MGEFLKRQMEYEKISVLECWKKKGEKKGKWGG
jgi:hypothetical protein